MKTTIVNERGTTSGQATINGIRNVIKPLLISYDNISFVEEYNTTSGVRFIFAIAGFPNIRLTVENQSYTNGYIYVRLYGVGNEHTNTYLENINFTFTTSTTTEMSQSEGRVYTFSKNNILYGLTLTPKTGTPAFIIGIDTLYVYWNKDAFKADGTKLAQYDGISNLSISTPETAIMINSIIAQGGSAYDGISSIFYRIINTQFSNMSFALIESNGVKYRQVFVSFLFIENGDEE